MKQRNDRKCLYVKENGTQQATFEQNIEPDFQAKPAFLCFPQIYAENSRRNKLKFYYCFNFLLKGWFCVQFTFQISQFFHFPKFNGIVSNLHQESVQSSVDITTFKILYLCIKMAFKNMKLNFYLQLKATVATFLCIFVHLQYFR